MNMKQTFTVSNVLLIGLLLASSAGLSGIEKGKRRKSDKKVKNLCVKNDAKVGGDLAIKGNVLLEGCDDQTLCEFLSRIECKINRCCILPEIGKKAVIVDVFTSTPYDSFPVVVMLDAGDFVTDGQFQEIAFEFNRQVVFLLSNQPVDGAWPLRVFVADGMEVGFSGSAANGAANVIFDLFLCGLGDSLTLNFVNGVGLIPITFEGPQNVAFSGSMPPDFGQIFDDAQKTEIAKIFNINRSDIDDTFPTQDVDTGLAAIIVPIKTLAAMESIVHDAESQMLELLFYDTQGPGGGETRAKQMVLFTTQDTVNPAVEIHARFFDTFFGFPEISVSGSSSSALATWLANNEFFSSPVVDTSMEGGVEIGEPSEIFIRAGLPDGTIPEGQFGGLAVKTVDSLVNPLPLP